MRNPASHGHRIDLDVSRASVVVVCSCGRRMVLDNVRSAAILAREHLTINNALAVGGDHVRAIRAVR